MLARFKIIFALGFLAGQLHAQFPIQLTVGSSKNTNETNVCIPITCNTNIEGLWSFSGVGTYDPEIVSYSTVNRGVLDDIVVNPLSELGQLRFLWFFDQTAIPIDSGDVLLEFCFDIIGQPGDQSLLDIENIDPPGLEMNTTDGITIPIVEGGCISLPSAEIVPTVSEWGTIFLFLLLLILFSVKIKSMQLTDSHTFAKS